MSLDADREKLRKLVEEYGLQSVLAELAEIAHAKAAQATPPQSARAWRQDASTLTIAAKDVNDHR